jgi:hypothetical protein
MTSCPLKHTHLIHCIASHTDAYLFETYSSYLIHATPIIITATPIHIDHTTITMGTNNHLLTLPTELQALIISDAIADDFHLKASIYDVSPTRHFAFERIPTYGITSRALIPLSPIWADIIHAIVSSHLKTKQTEYGPGWELVTTQDLELGQVCARHEKRMVGRLVVNEWNECAECNGLRREMLELMQLMGEIEGTVEPRPVEVAQTKSEGGRKKCEMWRPQAVKTKKVQGGGRRKDSGVAE